MKGTGTEHRVSKAELQWFVSVELGMDIKSLIKFCEIQICFKACQIPKAVSDI